MAARPKRSTRRRSTAPPNPPTVADGRRRPAARYRPLAGGQAVPFGIVRAHRFELVDRQGRIRGGLGFARDGSPALALFDAEGRPHARAELGLRRDGPSLALTDSRGAVRLLARCTEEMTALFINDAKGRTRLLLGLDPKGIVRVVSLDGRGEVFPFRQSQGRLDPDEMERTLRPLVEAGDRDGFARALIERYGICDSQHIGEVWALSRKLVAKEQRRAGRKGGRR